MRFSFFQRLSPAQHTLFFRLLWLYVSILIAFFVLNSTYLDVFSSTGSIGPNGISLFPLLLIGCLLLLFFLLHYADIKKQKTFTWPVASQKIYAVMGFLLAVFLTWQTMHPSAEMLTILNRFIDRDPLTNTAIIVTGLYTALLFPVVPLFFLFFPASYLRTHTRTLLFLALIFLAYLYGAVPEAAYYRQIGPWTVYFTQSILNALPGTNPALNRWTLGYNGFSAEFGYSCSEFSAVVLFLGLLLFLCWKLSKKHTVSVVHAVVVAVLGALMILIMNIVRIVLIMVIGSLVPQIGLYLFHGAVGSILLFVFCVFYLRLAIPFIARKKKKPQSSAQKGVPQQKKASRRPKRT